MRGRKRRYDRAATQARADARLEQIRRELADPASDTSQSVRRGRRIRNTVFLGCLVPLVAAALVTATRFVPVSWPALIAGVIYAGLLMLIVIVAGVLAGRRLRKTVGRDLLLAVLSEGARLGLVTLLGAGVAEAVWFALGGELAGAFAGSVMGALAFLVSHTDPVSTDAPRPISTWTMLLRTAADLAIATGFTLLLVRSPWLVLATIPATTLASWLRPEEGRPIAQVLLVKFTLGTAALTAAALLLT